jgi:BioD-like phosphotransacetylase family protein
VMSPVHIPRGFTKAYIAGEVVEDLAARIRDAHRTFASHDVLVVEGTGHAGVGAVIGLSNAVVASMLGAPAVIVSEGGVGRPIDEIVLNASHFAAHGVPVAGAIVNKVRMDEQPGIERTLERGLALHGIPLLGVLPYRPILSNPTLGMILEGVGGTVINPGPDLDRVIGNVAIAAMEPHHVMEHVRPDTLVIVPGDREDVILTLTTARLVGQPRPATPDELVGGAGPGRGEPLGLGLVLTGGYEPRDAVLAAISQSGMFAANVAQDTYTVASSIHDLLVKTHVADRGKIELIKELVWDYLEIDRVLNAATEARFS